MVDGAEMVPTSGREEDVGVGVEEEVGVVALCSGTGAAGGRGALGFAVTSSNMYLIRGRCLALLPMVETKMNN